VERAQKAKNVSSSVKPTQSCRATPENPSTADN